MHLSKLPKSIVEAVAAAECFNVEVRARRIVLTPVHIRHGDAVRALACPAFGLLATEHDELLEDYFPSTDVVRAPVIGDRDLPELAGACGMCPVAGLDAFCSCLLGT